jgi:uroporphyrinogen-III synthase
MIESLFSGVRMSSERALAGASVVLTRPAGTATSLARAACARGGTPLLLPGLRLAAAEDPVLAQAQLSAARGFPLWVFTSPAAVRYCAKLAPAQGWPDTTQMLAVGAGTAAELARHGIRAIAPAQRHDSEGLLAEPILGSVRGCTIALIDAPEGRDLLAPALRARGARVERIHVYRRLAPRLHQRHFDALAGAERPWLTLLSSGLALNHLLAALPFELATRWKGEALIVSSARLAAQARDSGFIDIHVASSALAADLLECAAAALARHRL